MRRDERNTDRMTVGGQEMRQTNKEKHKSWSYHCCLCIFCLTFSKQSFFFFPFVSLLKRFFFHVSLFCPLEGGMKCVDLLIFLHFISGILSQCQYKYIVQECASSLSLGPSLILQHSIFQEVLYLFSAYLNPACFSTAFATVKASHSSLNSFSQV